MGITPSAMAAGGAGTGTQSFCLDNFDCGILVLSVNYVNVVDRGGVVEFACGVTLPSSDVNFIGVSIQDCYVVNQSGGEHHGLQNGNAGPFTATGGGSTTLDDDGNYDVCVEGEAFYIDGARSFSECLAPILTF